MKKIGIVTIAVLFLSFIASCDVDVDFDPKGALQNIIDANEVDDFGTSGDMSWRVLKDGKVECTGTGQTCMSDTEYIVCEDGVVSYYTYDCESCEFDQCL